MRKKRSKASLAIGSKIAVGVVLGLSIGTTLSLTGENTVSGNSREFSGSTPSLDPNSAPSSAQIMNSIEQQYQQLLKLVDKLEIQRSTLVKKSQDAQLSAQQRDMATVNAKRMEQTLSTIEEKLDVLENKLPSLLTKFEKLRSKDKVTKAAQTSSP